jgi:hypothetical protein
MNRVTMHLMTVASFLCLGFVIPTDQALAQTAKDLVGAWTQFSNLATRPDGSKVETFGRNYKGSAIFDASGRFVIANANLDIPKFAANDRTKGTPEENKAVVVESLNLFGTYSVDPASKVITLKVEASSYPNWSGTDQKRTIVSFTGDELKWTLASATGGTPLELGWRRVK